MISSSTLSFRVSSDMNHDKECSVFNDIRGSGVLCGFYLLKINYSAMLSASHPKTWERSLSVDAAERQIPNVLHSAGLTEF